MYLKLDLRNCLRRLFTAALFVVPALGAVSNPAFAVGDYIRFEPAPWAQSVDATATIDGDSLPGTTIDFNDTLGLSVDETEPMGRLWFRLGKNRLIVDMAASSRDGREVLSQNLTFNDTTYSAAETVASDFDMQLLQAKYRRSVVDLKLVQFDLGVGLNLAQVDMRLDSSASGLTRLDEDIPFPTVNAAFVVKPLPGFQIRAEADGIALSVSGNKVDILDLRLQLEYYFAHFLGIFGGYRTYSFDVEAEDFGLIDASFDGVYFGLGVKF